LSGWEGSAVDGRVFDDAPRTDFLIPEGKIYLADAGFPSCDVLLVPYRGVRCHLKEWEQVSLWSTSIIPFLNLLLHAHSKTYSPRNPKALYNLRHAQL
jgi:hypothetical protein